jgi:Tol biopolymer transport system component/putative cell wall-binding protein
VRRLLLLVLVGALAAATPPAGAAAQPEPAAPPAVVFTRVDCDDDCGVWAREPDGTQRRLTDDARDRSPVWSPDAKEVAFVRGEAGLYAIGADGDGLRQLSADAVTDPTWSPDGRFLAFQRGADGQPDTFEDELAIVPADGSTGRVLATGVQSPSWSPDATRIAVQRAPTGSGPLLQVYDLDGDLVAAADGPQGWSANGTPAWSPDGATIAFGGSDSAGSFFSNATFLVPSSGGDARRISDDNYLPTRDAWSPDGVSLALSMRYPVALARTYSEVHVLAPHGTVRARTPGPDRLIELDAAWSQDAQQLFYARRDEERRESQLLVDSADLDDPRVLLDGVADLDVAPEPLTRRFGVTRIETAAAASRGAHASATSVVVAPADSYAEALLAAPLAGDLGAPVLLTNGDRLADGVAAEVQRLGAERAVVVDPRGVLGAAIDDGLRASGITEVRRLAGTSVFAAAAAVAAELPGDHAYVVEGASADPDRGWPDAVSVSALAAHQRRPVLLVERDRLPEETRDALQRTARTRVTIVGGPAAVSSGVEDQLRELGLEVDRLAGATRYETSRAVADASVAAGLDATTTWVVTGTNYPDALAAGPAAAANGAALVLVHGQALGASPPTADWFADAAVARAVLVGGRGAISPDTATQIAARITGAPLPLDLVFDVAVKDPGCSAKICSFQLSLWAADDDGTDPREVVPDASTASWSPDGRRIAFVRSHPAGSTSDYWVADAAAGRFTQLRPLTRFDGDECAQRSGAAIWAPDSSEIAFSCARADGRPALFVVEVATGQARTVPVPADAAAVGEPSWSPDGTALVYGFAREPDEAGTAGGIAVSSVGGAAGQPRVLASVEPSEVPAAVWSPQGDLIAYDDDHRSVDGPMVAELRVVQPDGAGARSVHSTGATPTALADLTWSPTGTHLAFRADVLSEGRSDVVVTDRTGAVAQLSPADRGPAGAPAWSPDARTVAFVSPEGIAANALDGSRYRLLIAAEGADFIPSRPDWRPVPDAG